MSAIEPPSAPAAPVSPVQYYYPQPRQRTWMPLIVALGIFGAIAALVGGIVISGTVATIVDSSDLRAAERAVSSLDAAYADADCDAFEAVTTEDARDDILGDDYDCDAFEAAAGALADGDEYAYSVTVLRSSKFDDQIVVNTRESFGDETPKRYTYVLVNEGAGWVVDKYGRD